MYFKDMKMPQSLTLDERIDLMVRLYGEVCTKATAAHILSCSSNIISAMLNDGRLIAACEGTRVDVRALAQYIATRKETDALVRCRKRYGNGPYAI